MPETVELYGLAWVRAAEPAATIFYHDIDGDPFYCARYWSERQELVLGDGTPHHCPTLGRAAMIVALLARPDAQFELVKKEGDDGA